MKKICYDSTSSLWVQDMQRNVFLVKCTAELIKNTLECRKYLYMNQIYECFGVRWNPDEENVCYRDPNTFVIDFEHTDEDSILIKFG